MRHFINIVILIFFFITEVRADGSPILQSIIVQGDYVFILAGGLYTIHEKDGRFDWEFDNEVHAIDEDYAGKVWALSMGDGCSYSRCFNGDNWTDYPYPRIAQHSSVRFFYFEDQYHMIAKEANSTDVVLYVIDGSQWKEETRFPEAFRDNIPYFSLNEDNLIVDAIRSYEKEVHYSYSFSKKEWYRTESLIEFKEYRREPIEETTYGRGYILVRKDLNQHGNYDTKTFTSPEGKVFTFDYNTESASSFPASIDEEGYCYFLTRTKSFISEEMRLFQLWSDRGGEWEVIATGDFSFYGFGEVAVSNIPKLAIWGSNGTTFLAFVRDGKWIEVALLPPEADAPYPDQDELDVFNERYEYLLEKCDDGEGMILSKIDDPDGYVNVRSQPGTHAPVTAIILKDVPFYCKKIGDRQWSKALLPSGTVGYVSSKLIQQH